MGNMDYGPPQYLLNYNELRPSEHAGMLRTWNNWLPERLDSGKLKMTELRQYDAKWAVVGKSPLRFKYTFLNSNLPGCWCSPWGTPGSLLAPCPSLPRLSLGRTPLCGDQTWQKRGQSLSSLNFKTNCLRSWPFHVTKFTKKQCH